MKQGITYSLFVKEGKNWTRLTPLALKLDVARRTFQNMLLGGSLEGHAMELRPAKEDWDRQAEYKANLDRIFPKKETNAETQS